MGDVKPAARPVVGVIMKCRVYREALASAILARWGFDVHDLGPGDAGSHAGLMATRPDVVLMDLPPPEAIDLVRVARLAGIRARFIGCDAVEDENVALRLFESGFQSYVHRAESLDDLHTTIVRTLRDELSCTPRIAAAMARRLGRAGPPAFASSARLSSRERVVLRFLNEALTNKEIAARLGISPYTVKNHVHSVLKKLGLHRRQEVSGFTRDRLSI